MKDSNEITLADLIGEVSPAEILEIVDPEEFEEQSLSVINENKKALSRLKNRVMLSLDKRKLKEAEKIISGMENISDIFSDPEIMDKVKGNIGTAMDMKFLSEAFAKLLDSHQKLMRLDSVDGQGTAARISIDVKFEGYSG